MAIINNIRKNADSLKEGGAAALGTLILGGSKAEAALAGVGQAILTKVIGPLGKVAGVTLMATRGIYNMTKAWATMGTGAAAKLETVQNQLRVMLKGLDAAKQRVRELRNFSIATPFKMPDIVAGNRALESLTKGALVTKEAMTMVGDAASQAGVGFEDMAVYVGRLYDGLEGGRPVGEVLFRLAELGVISGQARTALEQLQQGGAGFSEQWRVVEGELNRFKGTMGYTSKTLDGLNSTLEDTQEELKATFSSKFLEGQKEALIAQIHTLENLKPAVEGVADAYSGFVSTANTLSSKFAEWLTKLPGMATGLELVARAAGIAAAGLSGVIVVMGAGGLLKWITASTTALKAMQVVLMGLGRGLVALLASPLVAVAVALTAVIALWSMHADRVKRAAAAQREYNGATDAMLAKMEEQRAAIKKLDQLSAAYQSTLGGLAEAYRTAAQAQVELSEAQAKGDNRGIQEAGAKLRGAWSRIDALKQEATNLDAIDRGGLEKDEFYMQNAGAVKNNQRAEEKARLEADRQTMSPLAKAESYEREAAQLAARRGAALTENAQIEAFRVTKVGVGEKLAKNRAAQAEATGRMDENFNGDGAAYQQAREDLARLQQQEAALLAEEIKLADANGSAIVAMQARLALLAKYEAQAAGVRAATVALREAEKVEDEQERVKAVQAKTIALEEQQKALQAVEQAARAMNLNPAQAQEMRAELERRKAQLSQDVVNRPEEIAVRKQAEMERRQRRQSKMEAEGGARIKAEEEDGGALAAAEAQIVLERERLELQKEYQEIDAEVYAARQKALDSEWRMLRARRDMARAENAAEVKAGGLELGAKAMRLSGKGAQARALEEQAQREREEAGKAARVRELMDKTGMDKADAEKQVGQEIGQARLGRKMDQEGGLLQALLGKGQVVDNLQRIGGGGGVSQGGDIKKVVERLDKLIQEVKNQGGTTTLRI